MKFSDFWEYVDNVATGVVVLVVVSRQQQFQKIKQIMFDNFIEENPYHSSDPVFTHPTTKNRIFIGDIQAALDFDQLKANNIKTVVTAARDMDHVKYESSILHIVYPLLDGKNEDIASFFDAFYNLIETNIRKGNILVHCAAGISRSSTLVISYLMKFNKMTFKEAIALVRKSRPRFERQLKRYEQQIKGIEKASRNSRRGQSKTVESGQSQILTKTQFMPNLGAYLRPNLKEKLMSGQIGQKQNERDVRVLRVYNFHSRQDSKKKKFVITKKATSFSRQHKDPKILMVANFREQQAKNSSRELQRHTKTPLQEMKAIYLPKRAMLQRHIPSERGGTFYHPTTSRLNF